MPRSAIATGAVDLVLPAAKIADALVARERGEAFAPRPPRSPTQKPVADLLPEIVDLLRTKTVHDFTLYKHGTLERRIERRMAMAAIKPPRPIISTCCGATPTNSTALAKDLLINVTEFLSRPHGVRLPGRIRSFPTWCAAIAPDRPLRIWVAGCSTGEETYSLAMLFREAIAAAKRDVKLQIFATDVDPDAVARAREGLYPRSIEADVSPERLAQFFTKEDRGYRVSPELRACGRVHGPGRAGRSALLAPRFRFLPQSADLSAARSAGQGHLASSISRCAKAASCCSATPRRSAAADGRFAVVSKTAAPLPPHRR